jgi:hypothetical protein
MTLVLHAGANPTFLVFMGKGASTNVGCLLWGRFARAPSFYAITVTSKFRAASVTVDKGVSTTLKPELVLLVMVTKQDWLGVTCTV